MANLMEMLQSQLSEGVLNQLTQTIGANNKEQTQAAASGILSTLTAALAKNAATPEGASALASALDRDHDGSILDDVMGMLGGASNNNTPTQSSALNGAGILKHVLGGKQSNVIDMISKMSGLNSGQSGSLMEMLAPMVLGTLGKQKKQANLDQSGLSDILSKSVKSDASNNAQMSLITRFLDQDGDGSVMDDIAGMGMSMLGKFFKK
ncbi:MAG: DUF937 domain-containing protein [Saprospiraceae bacterium]